MYAFEGESLVIPLMWMWNGYYVAFSFVIIFSLDIHLNIFYTTSHKMGRSLWMPGHCRCLLCWPNTSSYTSHELRKSSPAQRVKSVKSFLAVKLKILPSLYYYRNNMAVLCFRPCQSHECVKMEKAFSSTSLSRTEMDVLIRPGRCSRTTQLPNISQRWTHGSYSTEVKWPWLPANMFLTRLYRLDQTWTRQLCSHKNPMNHEHVICFQYWEIFCFHIWQEARIRKSSRPQTPAPCGGTRCLTGHFFLKTHQWI